MTLSEEQKNVFRDIADFLDDKSKQVYVLKGYAGTGKTSLIKAITAYLAINNTYFQIAAPTGRAAKILHEKTGLPATTIHKCIYDFDSMKFDEDELCFIFSVKAAGPAYRSIFIFDEASMIGDKSPGKNQGLIFGSGSLLSDIFSFCKPDLKNGIKIIFAGDNAQLPPVTDKESKALIPEKLTEMGFPARHGMLTQVFRTLAGHPVMKLSKHVRDALENKDFSKLHIDYGEKIQALSFSQISEKYRNINSGSKIIICWSNRLALTYSMIIREQVYKRKNTLEAGERVMIAKNNYYDGHVLYNGSFAEISALGTGEYERKISLKEKGNKIKTVILRYRDAVLLTDDQEEVKAKIFMNFLTEPESNPFAKYGRAMFVDALKRAAAEGIKYYPGHKLKNEAFTQWLKRDEWYNCLILKYGYAITCHKAQGGEWEHVFVDPTQLTGKRSINYFRWFYTAISRSSDYLYLIDPPDIRPFSDMVIKQAQIKKASTKAWYYQYQIAEDTENPYYQQFPFLKERFEKLQKTALEQDWKVEINHKQYQEEYTFVSLKARVKIRQYYNKEYFKAEWSYISGDMAYQKQINELLQQSMFLSAPPAPACMDIRQDFYEIIRDICNETGIIISNVFTDRYQIKIYLITDYPATECLAWIDDKNKLTFLQINALQPDKDRKYQQLIEKIKALKEG